MTLLPGDVILTGTPEGVGPIVAGDEVSVTVSGIGTLTIPVAAKGGLPAGGCPGSCGLGSPRRAAR